MNNKKQKIRKLSAIDLFAGAGGLSLSALNCDINVIAAIEFDKDASETYRENIIKKRSENTKLYSSDILQIDPALFKEELKLQEGDLDILVGGPPCQGFSTHRINGQGIDDPRNKLLLRYFDFVKVLKPKIFLVENVPGILWKRHEKYLAQFNKLAQKNGYKVFAPIKINAKDYGVPQNRERVFILGVETEICTENLQWPPASTHFAPGKENPEWLTASVVFEKPPNKVLEEVALIIGQTKTNALKFGSQIKKESYDSNAIHMKHTENLLARIRETPVNGSREDISFRLPCHSDGYKGHKDVYGRIKLAQAGPTITTGCFNPSKGRFLHPWLHHGITIRHAARFQTFPEDFLFSGGITSQGKQVGNAVPVKLGEHLLNCIKSLLINQEQFQN